MDALHVFGYGGNGQFPDVAAVDSREHLDVQKLSTPTCAFRAENIEIMWASWCDLIIAVDNHSLRYWGSSLTEAQSQAIEKLPMATTCWPIFFGRHDSAGVLGCILPRERSIAVFHTIEEIGEGTEPVTEHSFVDEPFDILGIKFTARESILVSIKPRHSPTLEGGTVIDLPSLTHLQDALRSRTTLSSHGIERLYFAPSQWCTNHATFTAVNSEGSVYTYATDRRPAHAVGRAIEHRSDPHAQGCGQRIEYLSESVVEKVTGGGLYTAALSKDNELFLWGQATPDTKEELGDVVDVDEDEDADDYVRLQNLRTGGELARVTDVAVGAGYVLVATRGEEERGHIHQDDQVPCKVWAMGNNLKGSLGLGEAMDGKKVVKTYMEVKAFRGKKIKQMVCAAWSSFMVVREGERLPEPETWTKPKHGQA